MIKDNNDRIWILISFIFHAIAAYNSTGFHQGDEHYHLVEFAYFKLGKVLSKDLMWEYSQEMRSFILPFFYYILHKFFSLFFELDIFLFLKILRFISSFFGFYILVKLSKYSSNKKTIIFSALIWYLPFIHARISSEVWASNLFFLAFFYLHEKKYVSSIVSMLLLFLAAMIRIQMVLMIVPLIIYLLLKNYKNLNDNSIKKTMIDLSMGLFLAIFVEYLCNYWGYGKISHVPFNYFKVNIIDGYANAHGISPWWWYFRAILARNYFFLGLILIISYIYFIFHHPKHILTSIILPYFIGHCFISHKEFRFIFPLAYVSPHLLAEFYDFITLKFEKIMTVILSPVYMINFVFLIISCFYPANDNIYFSEKLISKEKKNQIPEIIYISKIENGIAHPPASPHLFFKESDLSYRVVSFEEINSKISKLKANTLVYLDPNDLNNENFVLNSQCKFKYTIENFIKSKRIKKINIDLVHFFEKLLPISGNSSSKAFLSFFNISPERNIFLCNDQ